MGYRSDVKYVMAFMDKDARDTYVAVQKMAGGEGYEEAIKDWDLDVQEDRIYFSADNWKWYESFPVVQAHDELLSKCYDMGGAYVFYRIGENWDDMEERYECSDGMECPWDAIQVNRSVDFC